jgi:hypothetical protein
MDSFRAERAVSNIPKWYLLRFNFEINMLQDKSTCAKKGETIRNLSYGQRAVSRANSQVTLLFLG